MLNGAQVTKIVHDESTDSDTCGTCGQFLFMHHKAQACAPARDALEGYCERELANAREHDPRYRTMAELAAADSDPDRPF
jgi:hypothetical protein